MALTINSQNITIEETTAEINITVTPMCALILAADENHLIALA